MNKSLFLGAAAAMALGFAATAANAVTVITTPGMTWTTQLDWAPNGHTGVPTPYGTVTLQETDANDVKVTVALANGVSFADNGNGHVMFGFNLLDGNSALTDSTVTWQSGSGFAASNVTYGSSAVADNTPGHNDFSNSPFGHYDNAWDFSTTAPGTLSGPFVFNVHNDNGITFAGVGATYDSLTGQLITTGSGNHFFSNSDGGGDSSVPGSQTGGWWFSADTSGTLGSGCSPTCAVAGRDAFTPIVNVVPEPATWALMILGVGGAGAMLRRRRAMAFAA